MEYDKLWIDDMRKPPDESWFWAKTSKEALEALILYDIKYIGFDHDLGDNDDAYVVALEIEEQAVCGIEPPKWHVHSSNPAGRVRIENCMNKAHEIYETNMKSYEAWKNG